MKTTDPWPYPRWVAHRGAGKLAPENTLAAFRLGAAHGYRMFECDAKLSRDGVPFLLHDATLQRTTYRSGTGGDLDWGTLAQLDAGRWHSRAYAGEPLPTLQALAHYCIANGYFLNVEIKPTPGIEEKTGQVVGAQCAQPAARRHTFRARCWSTRCGTGGWLWRANWAAWPSCATTPCGTPRWWPPSTAKACEP